MTDGGQGEIGKAIWQKARKVSADEISAYANLRRLFAQREVFRKENWSLLAQNQERSVFYQVDLLEAAEEFAKGGIALPGELPEGSPLLKRISDAMFRAKVLELEGKPEAKALEDRAFGLMRQGLTGTMDHRQQPKLSVYADQIVWSRSPVRIDIAGGWTDTPPYSLMEGGNVVNLAIELNGIHRRKEAVRLWDVPENRSTASPCVPSTWGPWRWCLPTRSCRIIARWVRRSPFRKRH